MTRADVMTFAWRQWRYARERGWHLDPSDPWTWSRCLKWAWKAYRARKERDIWRLVEAAAQSHLPTLPAISNYLDRLVTPRVITPSMLFQSK